MILKLSLISFITTLIILNILLPYLTRNIYAEPSKRGMHSGNKPTGAGIFFALIISIICYIKNFYLPLLCLPLSIISLLDDKYNIPRFIRYLSQVIFIIAIYYLFKIDYSISLFFNNFYIHYFILFLIIFFGTGIINLINFMDGIDGLVSGCFMVASFFIYINGDYNFLIIIGSLLAFIILNWYPSKIFMGDSGSIFLGSLIVSYALKSENILDGIKFLILFTPLILDSTICILLRIKNKQKIFRAHKLHLYQRLVLNGFNHSTVSIMYISATFFIGIMYTFFNIYALLLSSFFTLIIGIFINNKYAIDFNKEK